jgi:hypothetical protein
MIIGLKYAKPYNGTLAAMSCRELLLIVSNAQKVAQEGGDLPDP